MKLVDSNKDNWKELVNIVKPGDKKLIKNLCEKNYLKYLKN